VPLTPAPPGGRPYARLLGRPCSMWAPRPSAEGGATIRTPCWNGAPRFRDEGGDPRAAGAVRLPTTPTQRPSHHARGHGTRPSEADRGSRDCTWLQRRDLGCDKPCTHPGGTMLYQPRRDAPRPGSSVVTDLAGALLLPVRLAGRRRPLHRPTVAGQVAPRARAQTSSPALGAPRRRRPVAAAAATPSANSPARRSARREHHAVLHCN